jgi:hypothetical protein
MVTVQTVLSFIEFLVASNLAIPTIKNYITSIKSHFKANSVSVEVFGSHHLTLALSSLSKNYSPSTSIKPIFSPLQFIQLINSTVHLPLHILYKMAFILGFFGFA